MTEVWDESNFLYADIHQRFERVQFVSNKAKRRISKRVLQENKARQIIQKTNIS